MNRKLTDVLVERERLLARCVQQRDIVATCAQGLAGPAAVLDRLVATGRFLGRHPVVVAGAVATVVVLRARFVLRLAVRGFGLWRLVHRARFFMQLLQR